MVLDFCAARSENDEDLMVQLDCPEPPTQMTYHFVGFCLPKMVASLTWQRNGRVLKLGLRKLQSFRLRQGATPL